MKEHLDFDTDFLNKAASEKKPAAVPSSGGKPASSGWKAWLIGGGVLFALMIIGALSDSTTSTSTTSSSSRTTTGPSNNVQVGQYSCSSYNSDRADDLKPDYSCDAIDKESTALDVRIAALESLGNRIENMQVDEYDQASVDSYNALLANYKTTRARLDADIATYNAKLTRCNSQVGTYNAFLENNCTRSR